MLYNIIIVYWPYRKYIKTFLIYIVFTLLKQDNTFFISIKGLISTRIQGEIQLPILSNFERKIQELFLLYLVDILIHVFFFIFSSLFFLYFSCWLSSSICSYEVATIACYCTLCNKLLIFKKKKVYKL